MTKTEFKRLKKKVLIGLSGEERQNAIKIFDNYYYGFPNHGMATDKERRARHWKDLHKMSKMLKGVNISKDMGWE